MREAQVAGTNDIRPQCRSGPASPPGFHPCAGRIRAFALPGLAAFAGPLGGAQACKSARADRTRLSDNESPPGFDRPPESLPSGAGGTAHLRHDGPGPFRAAARRAAAGFAVVLVGLSALPAHAQTAVTLPPPETEVPNDWSLKPTGLATGDKFRLIFLSSTKSDATDTDIGTYNTFIQGLAAAGHTDIQSYSSGFRVVGCTASVDAVDNTGTTGTGVPIHWLGGNQVADDYADFYDGSWADEANDKNASGSNGPDTSQEPNYPFTGCRSTGVEATILGGLSRSRSVRTVCASAGPTPPRS